MPVWLVARITFLETLRKKDFFALLILLGVYTLLAKVVLQARPNDESIHTLLFGLGLMFGFAASAILVVVLTARQIPKEIEQGTILPLLARPLSRAQVLLGKFLACWLVGVFSLLCFVVLIRLLIPSPPLFSEALFVQTCALKAAALAALAALTLMLSLLLPEILNVLVSLGYYFLWGIVFNILHDSLVRLSDSWGAAVARGLYVLPQLGVLNVSRICLAESLPLHWGEVFALTGYAIAYTGIALLIAYSVFERRWV